MEKDKILNILRLIGIDEEKVQYIYWWIIEHIFNDEGDLVYVDKEGKLRKEYPHKQLKRLYAGLPRDVVPLLHTKEVRRLWGSLREDLENISFVEYERLGNEIIKYRRYRSSYISFANEQYNDHVDWFISLLSAISSDNTDDVTFLLHYSALLVQKRTHKDRSNRLLILHSLLQGVGKSTFSNIISRILNGSNVHPDVFKGKFDAHRLGLKNLCVVEEGEELQKGHYAMIKALITAEKMETTVKHSMEDLEIPSSFECIITTNKRPNTLRNQSNRRDIVIECKGLSEERRRRLFEGLKIDDHLIGNIEKMLQNFPMDRKIVEKYQQKDDRSLLVAVNEFQLLVKLFLETSLIPVAAEHMMGDWKMVRWNGQIDTGMSKRNWYELYTLYSTYMNARMIVGYRYFLEEMKRIAGDWFMTDGNTVVIGNREGLLHRYTSIFVRDTIHELSVAEDLSFKMMLELV